MMIKERKYQLGTRENREFLDQIREDLFAFGRRFPSPEGGSYYLGDDGTPWKERNRETYITCRMVHVYSIAKFLGKEAVDELIDAGLSGLTGELQDHTFGGWYTGVTPDGKGLPGKLCYAHAFDIGGVFCSFGGQTGSPGAVGACIKDLR